MIDQGRGCDSYGSRQQLDQMRLFAFLVLCLLGQSLRADDFKNWYFVRLSQSASVSGELISPSGKKFGTFSGSVSGKLSPGGKAFVEKSKLSVKYQGEEDEVSSESIEWSVAEGGRFAGKLMAKNGTVAHYKLTVEKDTLTINSATADGRSMHTVGKKKGDKISMEETVRTKAGKVVFVVKYTIEMAKPKSKRGG